MKNNITSKYKEDIAQEIFDKIWKKCVPSRDWVDCIDIDTLMDIFREYGVKRR